MWRFVRLARDDGMVPEKEHMLRYMSVRDVRLPSSGGSFPPRPALPVRHKEVRAESAPISPGIVPERSSLYQDSSVTLPLFTVIPIHFDTSSRSSSKSPLRSLTSSPPQPLHSISTVFLSCSSVILGGEGLKSSSSSVMRPCRSDIPLRGEILGF